MAPSLTFSIIVAFLVAWAAALVLGLSLKHWPVFRYRYVRQEKGRTSEHPLFFRLGGLVLVGGFLIALFLDTRLVWDQALQTLVIGGLVALILGCIDDIYPLHWYWQLLGQLALGGWLLLAGMSIEYIHFGGGVVLHFADIPFLGEGITLLWVLLVMNAVNWVDGADGIMGGVTGVTLGVLVMLSLRPEVNQPTLALLGMMLLGALVGFLFFNWYPAQMIAGSGGSAFLGFVLAALSVYAGTKVATALLVLAIPILDAVSVILTRFRLGRALFLPDRSHFHHTLLSLGWSPQKIAMFYSGITLLMGMLALSTQHLEKFWVFLCAAVFFFVVLGWMQWIMTKRTSHT